MVSELLIDGLYYKGPSRYSGRGNYYTLIILILNHETCML